MGLTAENTGARAIKAIVDRIGAAILLVLVAPLFALIAGLVGVTSPGSIIYRRRVVGLGGVEFEAFKFRTMVVDAERMLQEDPDLSARFSANVKLRDDPRLTPIGGFLRRTSLDELPQLVNVLRGEMSLVGPRIIALHEASKYGRFLEKRLSVKPGITGLWQVSGRQDVSYDRRIELDMQYIDSWSLRLDLIILLRTVPAVLSMRGAY